MKLKNPKITLLVNQDQTTIEIYDESSCYTFIDITLTPEQLSSALSRLARTECSVEVNNLDHVGKQRIMEPLIFEIPLDLMLKSNNPRIYDIALKNTPIGYTPSSYFSSKDTFFEKDGKCYVRTKMFKWIDDIDSE